MSSRLKWSSPLFPRSEALQEIGQVGAHFVGQGGACESAWGNHGDDRTGFFTTLDNILTFGESEKGKEGVGQRHPHPEDLPEGAGRGGEKLHGGRDRQGAPAACQHYQKCLKIAGAYMKKN